MGDLSVSEWISRVEENRKKLVLEGLKELKTIVEEEKEHIDKLNTRAYHLSNREEQKRLRAIAHTLSLKRWNK